MKTLISIIALTSILTLTSMDQNSNIKGLLEKPETRKEIFNAIINDHRLMTEFMQAMHGNEHAMMMIRGDNEMTMGGEKMGMNGSSQMTDRNSMMNIIHQNPAMMQIMMGNMIDVVATDSTMCHSMVNMVTAHPQMMQMMMYKFNNKMNMGTTIGNKMTPVENIKENMGQTHQH